MISNECRCGAHSQHRVFAFFFDNPGVSEKAAAKELGMSHVAVRLAKMRVKQRNTRVLCPACFEEALEGIVCRSCGAELDQPEIANPLPAFSAPLHSIQPLGGLGSLTDYDRLGLQYGGRNIAHLVEKERDPLLERCKSRLWQELKEVMPPDEVVEEATRLLTKEVREFRLRYPGLIKSKNLSSQLAGIVVDRLALRYPSLRRRSVTLSAAVEGAGD